MAVSAPVSLATIREAPGTQRAAGLDGLRAIAVILVLTYHFLPTALPGGFIGVDVFFVISGFLITTLLLRERAAGRIVVPQFWVRRARRLLPALLLVVLVCVPVALAIGGDVLVGIGPQLFGAVSFSSNWVYIAQDQSYFLASAPQLFRNLWSLAVEEQFYLLWPIVVAVLITLMRKPRIIVAVLTALALVSAVWMGVLFSPGTDPSRVYYGSDTHLFGLALGAALAFGLSRRKPVDLDTGETGWQYLKRVHSGWIGLLALVGVLVCAWLISADGALTYRGGLFLVCVLTGIVIFAATTSHSRFGKLLDVAPLRFIGRRSYGIYLWHWPILVLLTAATGPAGVVPLRAVEVAGLAAPLTLIAATLSYRFVETPIRVRGFRTCYRTVTSTTPRTVIAVSLSMVLLTATVVAVAVAVAVAPTATAAQQQIERGQAALHHTPTPSPTVTPQQPTATPTPPPTQAPITVTGAEVTAVGDSVMLAATPELQQTLPGIAIDAEVSRQPRTAPQILQQLADAGTLRPVVVLGLGTNGYWGQGTLDQVLHVIGPERKLVLVTGYAPKPWIESVNTYDNQIAAAHPGQVLIADWATAISQQPQLLGPDGIHPGLAGGTLYATVLKEALTRLR